MVDIGIYPNEDGSNEILNFMSSGSKGFSSLEEASDSIASYLPHREKPKDIFPRREDFSRCFFPRAIAKGNANKIEFLKVLQKLHWI